MSPIELSWTAKNIQNNSEYAISLYLQLGAGDGGAGGDTRTVIFPECILKRYMHGFCLYKAILRQMKRNRMLKWYFCLKFVFSHVSIIYYFIYLHLFFKECELQIQIFYGKTEAKLLWIGRSFITLIQQQKVSFDSTFIHTLNFVYLRVQEAEAECYADF